MFGKFAVLLLLPHMAQMLETSVITEILCGHFQSLSIHQPTVCSLSTFLLFMVHVFFQFGENIFSSFSRRKMTDILFLITHFSPKNLVYVGVTCVAQ